MIEAAQSLTSNTGLTLISVEDYRFCVNDLSWQLDRGTPINLSAVKKLVTEDVFNGYINTLSFFATERSPRTVRHIHHIYLDLLRFADGKAIDCQLISTYRKNNDTADSQIAFLRILFNSWLNLGCSGLKSEVPLLLQSWKLKGAIKGDAVKRLDPEEGPFSDLELQGFLEAIFQNLEKGGISITRASLVVLLQASGRRPYQLGNLKIKDLIRLPDGNGFFKYFVNVPRLKQPTRGFRKLFRKVQITEEIWELLQLQKSCVIAEFANQINMSLPELVIDELPLYFNKRRLSKISTLVELQTLTSSDYLHMLRGQMQSIVENTFNAGEIISERTGKPLKITAKRFRYTLGTRAAREGYGVKVIAELLDHSDDQNADVYTVNVPEHAAHIDFVIGNHIAPYAKAFAGILVQDKRHAPGGCVPGSDVRDFTGNSTGTCGHGGVCGAGVPVPCYTCHHFQAWLDGPHELIYAQLVKERDEVMRVTGDAAVAAVNDRTILAVAEVVEACNSHKKKL